MSATVCSLIHSGLWNVSCRGCHNPRLSLCPCVVLGMWDLRVFLVSLMKSCLLLLLEQAQCGLLEAELLLAVPGAGGVTLIIWIKWWSKMLLSLQFLSMQAARTVTSRGWHVVEQTQSPDKPLSAQGNRRGGRNRTNKGDGTAPSSTSRKQHIFWHSLAIWV